MELQLNKTSRIGFIGAGNMGEALIKGMLASGLVLPAKIVASDIRTERLRFLKNTYGIETLTDNREVISRVDVVILAIKPQIMNVVIQEVNSLIDSSKLIISIVAGATIQSISKKLESKARIIRAMPNTPALIRAGLPLYLPANLLRKMM